MKKFVLITLLFSFLNGLSQNFSDKEITKLNKLNIETKNFDLNDINIQKDLNKILKFERKRKTKKTVGIILATLSIIPISYGIIGISHKSDLVKSFGVVGVIGGGTLGGISINLLSSSKKKKKERDELLKKFE